MTIVQEKYDINVIAAPEPKHEMKDTIVSRLYPTISKAPRRERFGRNERKYSNGGCFEDLESKLWLSVVYTEKC